MINEIDKIILTNKVDYELIIFNKKYDYEYLKFYVNRCIELKYTLKEINDKLKYMFDVKDIIYLNDIYKLYYINNEEANNVKDKR